MLVGAVAAYTREITEIVPVVTGFEQAFLTGSSAEASYLKDILSTYSAERMPRPSLVTNNSSYIFKQLLRSYIVYLFKRYKTHITILLVILLGNSRTFAADAPAHPFDATLVWFGVTESDFAA
jgi:hypothetical protein